MHLTDRHVYAHAGFPFRIGTQFKMNFIGLFYCKKIVIFFFFFVCDKSLFCAKRLIYRIVEPNIYEAIHFEYTHLSAHNVTCFREHNINWKYAAAGWAQAIWAEIYFHKTKREIEFWKVNQRWRRSDTVVGKGKPPTRYTARLHGVGRPVLSVTCVYIYVIKRCCWYLTR